MKCALVALGALIMLTQCGLQTVAENTQNAVQSGNFTQEAIRKSLERTELLTKAMNELMEKTASGVHLQLLTVSLEQLLSPRNTAVLTPPVRMMPFAQAFAQEANPLELIQTVHLLFTDATLSPESEQNYRVAAMVGISLLGAFAPAKSIAQIQLDQIENHGRYESTSYILLTGRYMALRDYFLGDILENGAYLNVGALIESASHFSLMKQIALVPYVSKLLIEIENLGIEVKVELSELKAVGLKTFKKFQQNLSTEALQSPNIVQILKTLIEI